MIILRQKEFGLMGKAARKLSGRIAKKVSPKLQKAIKEVEQLDKEKVSLEDRQLFNRIQRGEKSRVKISNKNSYNPFKDTVTVKKKDPYNFSHELGHKKRHQEGKTTGKTDDTMILETMPYLVPEQGLPKRARAIKDSLKLFKQRAGNLIEERGAWKEGEKVLKKYGATKDQMKRFKDHKRKCLRTYINNGAETIALEPIAAYANK